MQPRELLDTARALLATDSRVPSEAARRKAVSTCYYALFHCLASECADLLAGRSPAVRGTEPWLQVYRALEHGFARGQCRTVETDVRWIEIGRAHV